jgi:cob(I)alamin adenosyltransferase
MAAVTHYDADHTRSVASGTGKLRPCRVGIRSPVSTFTTEERRGDGVIHRLVTLLAMVNLTRIYTRTGDGGQTRLGDMSTTTKTDLRLQAYADVDEANAHLGLALAQGELDEDVAAVLVRVQNDLFDVGADFCTPVVENPEFPPLRIEQAYVDRLEAWCDHYNEDLPALRSFILNGGTPGAALLHVARTVVRRAERSAWAAHEVHGASMNPLAITYLNRLSDLLFILARYANREAGDVLWVPGGERDAD